MKDSSYLTPTDEKYEPPQAVRLNDVHAGSGSPCVPGSSATDCSIGSRATQNCNTGNTAGNHCKTGTSVL